MKFLGVARVLFGVGSVLVGVSCKKKSTLKVLFEESNGEIAWFYLGVCLRFLWVWRLFSFGLEFETHLLVMRVLGTFLL